VLVHCSRGIALLGLLIATAGGTRPVQHPAQIVGDTAGLTPFIGTWMGEGTGVTGPIRDSLTFSSALDGRALRFSLVALSADRFEAEGFLWRAGSLRQMELVEFSTVDPFRHFLGALTGGDLLLKETPAERHTSVRLALQPDGTLRLQEIDTGSSPARVFVDELFRRTGS
jgi:hypothetical protein